MPFLHAVIQWANSPKACGYYASALLLAALCMRRLRQLRLVAMASNIPFFNYGLELHLMPVALLHAASFPINVRRLRQCIAALNSTDRAVGHRRQIVSLTRILAILCTSAIGGNFACFPEHWIPRNLMSGAQGPWIEQNCCPVGH